MSWYTMMWYTMIVGRADARVAPKIRKEKEPRMMSPPKAPQNLSQYLDRIAAEWLALPVFVLPPDCRGDGYDIAEFPRPDLAAEIALGLAQRGVKVVVTPISLAQGGPVCGYRLQPVGGLRLAQHSGAWGPWYHLSEYDGTRFVRRIGGHYNRRQAEALGLPFGRPAKGQS